MGEGITEIVIDGGPCSGKSSSMAALSAKLTDWGFRTLVVPELATTVITGGLADIGTIAARDPGHFRDIEVAMLRMMRANRLGYRALAQTFVDRGEKVVILYDRAEADVAAYVGEAAFTLLCQNAGLSALEVRDSYDAVILLVTAAFGAEAAYTTANNAARRETLEEAREMDLRTRRAWQGHPHLRVIDNSTDFEGKIARTLAAVARVLGIPEPLEIERKFLLETIPTPAVLEELGAVPVEIEQTYLLSPDPTLERRVRRRGPAGHAAYYYAEKRRIDERTRTERERLLDPAQYLALLDEADPERHPIRKIRHHFVAAYAYFELDIYTDPAGLCTLEVELISADTAVSVPPELGAWREVTGDPAYSNATLALGSRP
jgi:CYTH domain-containing protein/thymidylate kinase